MKHVDADAALRNEFLMELFQGVEETAMDNFKGCSLEDHLTPVYSKAQMATISLLREQLEEACKVQQ